MDLIGDYGSDVSDEEPEGPSSNGTVSAGNGASTGPAAAVSQPVSEQLGRLPAPKAADSDRWGSVFGAGILDRKRKTAASAGGGHSHGTAADAAGGAATNGDGHAEAAAPKRKLASFMAPLKPLTAEEMEVRGVWSLSLGPMSSTSRLVPCIHAA